MRLKREEQEAAVAEFRRWLRTGRVPGVFVFTRKQAKPRREQQEAMLADLRSRVRSGGDTAVFMLTREEEKRQDINRFRWAGKEGADHAGYPLDAHLALVEQRFHAELAKVLRVSDLHERRKLATAARRAKAHRPEVLALAALPLYANKGRGMAGAIARQLGLSASQVRRILTKARQRNAHD